MSNNRFEKLLEPYHIGSVKTRNRIIKSAAGLQYWVQGDNPVTKKALYFFDALARGGVGLIIMESPSIEAGGKSFRLDNDKHIKAMSEVTGTIHQYGCPVFVQLAHMANWNMRKSPEYDTRGASPVCVSSEMDNHGFMPRELAIPEIKEITQKFINNAVGAKSAGFDGVEINTSCSHLLHTFLSPFWNKRHDEYGCDSLENRTRLLVEIIRGIKGRLGADFPVSTIINGVETGALIGVDARECLSLEDAKKIARIIEQAGADAIQVRSQWIGRHDSSFLTDHLFYPEPPVPLSSFPKELDMTRHGAGANANMAAAVKKVVSLPIITVGRLDPELGEQILREGKADFIAMTRRLFADPELPNKIAAGNIEDIAPCTSCTCCKAENAHRRCRIHACIGTEKTYSMEPLGTKKKVLIAGGGPGGMEAARVAAKRGHDVTLVEKTGRLGGLLHLAAMVKGLEIEDLPAIIRYFSSQFRKLGVNVRLSTVLSEKLVQELKPDVLIVATGGAPTLPDIPGIDGPNVVKNTDLHRMLKFFLKFVSPNTLRSLTKFWMPIGKRVVVIGGGMHGCELAEFLVKRNRKVTIVDSMDELGTDMIQHLKQQLFWWFNEKHVELVPGVRPVAITPKGLTVLTKQGYNRTIPADTVIPAVPMKPDTRLADDYRKTVSEVYTVGDCGHPGIIADAIAAGWKIGNTI